MEDVGTPLAASTTSGTTPLQPLLASQEQQEQQHNSPDSDSNKQEPTPTPTLVTGTIAPKSSPTCSVSSPSSSSSSSSSSSLPDVEDDADIDEDNIQQQMDSHLAALRQAVATTGSTSDHAALVDALQLYDDAVALRAARNAWADAHLLPTSAWLSWLRDEELALMTTDTVTGSDSDMKDMSTVTSAKVKAEIEQLNAFALRAVQACPSPALFEKWLTLPGVDPQLVLQYATCFGAIAHFHDGAKLWDAIHNRMSIKNNKNDDRDVNNLNSEITTNSSHSRQCAHIENVSGDKNIAHNDEKKSDGDAEGNIGIDDDVKNTGKQTAADMDMRDSSSKISAQDDEKAIEDADTVAPVSDNNVEPSSDNGQNGANALATATAKADETTNAEDRKIVNKIEQDTCVNTEQIGADEDGDKVMQDKRIDDDDAKLHRSSVPSEAGGVTGAVNKVGNNRPPFATDEGEVADSCRLFEQRIADAMHDADAAVASHLSYAAYCVQMKLLSSATSVFERLVETHMTYPPAWLVYLESDACNDCHAVAKRAAIAIPTDFMIWSARLTNVTDVNDLCQTLARCVPFAASSNDLVGAGRATRAAWASLYDLERCENRLDEFDNDVLGHDDHKDQVEKTELQMKDDDDLKVSPGTNNSNVRSTTAHSAAALQAVLDAIDQLNVSQSTEWASAACFAAAILMRWGKTQQAQDLYERVVQTRGSEPRWWLSYAEGLTKYASSIGCDDGEAEKLLNTVRSVYERAIDSVWNSHDVGIIEDAWLKFEVDLCKHLNESTETDANVDADDKKNIAHAGNNSRKKISITLATQCARVATTAQKKRTIVNHAAPPSPLYMGGAAIGARVESDENGNVTGNGNGNEGRTDNSNVGNDGNNNHNNVPQHRYGHRSYGHHHNHQHGRNHGYGYGGGHRRSYNNNNHYLRKDMQQQQQQQRHNHHNKYGTDPQDHRHQRNAPNTGADAAFDNNDDALNRKRNRNERNGAKSKRRYDGDKSSNDDDHTTGGGRHSGAGGGRGASINSEAVEQDEPQVANDTVNRRDGSGKNAAGAAHETANDHDMGNEDDVARATANAAQNETVDATEQQPEKQAQGDQTMDVEGMSSASPSNQKDGTADDGSELKGNTDDQRDEQHNNRDRDRDRDRDRENDRDDRNYDRDNRPYRHNRRFRDRDRDRENNNDREYVQADIEPRTIYLNNLPYKASEEDIRNAFSFAGEIREVRMPRRNDGAFKGIAYVQFEHDDAVETAMTKHRSVVLGREVWVRKSHRRPGYGQGRRGGGGSGGLNNNNGNNRRRENNRDGGGGGGRFRGAVGPRGMGGRRTRINLDSGMMMMMHPGGGVGIGGVVGGAGGGPVMDAGGMDTGEGGIMQQRQEQSRALQEQSTQQQASQQQQPLQQQQEQPKLGGPSAGAGVDDAGDAGGLPSMMDYDQHQQQQQHQQQAVSIVGHAHQHHGHHPLALAHPHSLPHPPMHHHPGGDQMAAAAAAAMGMGMGMGVGMNMTMSGMPHTPHPHPGPPSHMGYNMNVMSPNGMHHHPHPHVPHLPPNSPGPRHDGGGGAGGAAAGAAGASGAAAATGGGAAVVGIPIAHAHHAHAHLHHPASMNAAVAAAQHHHHDVNIHAHHHQAVQQQHAHGGVVPHVHAHGNAPPPGAVAAVAVDAVGGQIHVQNMGHQDVHVVHGGGSNGPGISGNNNNTSKDSDNRGAGGVNNSGDGSINLMRSQDDFRAMFLGKSAAQASGGGGGDGSGVTDGSGSNAEGGGEASGKHESNNINSNSNMNNNNNSNNNNNM